MTPMLYLIVKAVLSGIVIAVVSDVAKRSPAFAALIVSLPVVSILALVWLWNDTGDSERVASLALGTFWFVLPSLALFIALPVLLRGGIGFWIALMIACAITVALYVAMVWLLARFGITL